MDESVPNLIEFLSTVSCRLHPPKCPRFLTFTWLLDTRCPTHFLFFVFFCDLRRGSVSSMTPHQYWNVCDWETTERDKTKHSSALSSHTHTSKVRENHPSDCAHQDFERIVQFLPFAAFNSFVDWLAKGMPISVNQRRSPPVLRKMTHIDVLFLGLHFLRSQRQFLNTFPDYLFGTPNLSILAFAPGKALYLHSGDPLPGHGGCPL